MCVAVPGKVTEINGFAGKVDFQGNIIDVSLALVDAEIGDYVLVHAGCAIEILKEETAKEILDLFAELESLTS